MKPLHVLLSLLVVGWAASLSAAVRLGSPFGDHMVLQQGKPVPVWGWAEAGEDVTVSFAGQTIRAKAGSDGRWSASFEPMTASANSRALVVTATSLATPLVLKDVLVGEVWLCGGQSNMERQLGLRSGQKPLVGWEADVASARYPLIRQLYVRQTRATEPQAEVKAAWTVCSPETAPDFTAVGFYFARELFVTRGVPIGILHSSWGGTPAEAWTSEAGLAEFPEFRDALNDLRSTPAAQERATQRAEEKLKGWFAKNDPGSGSAPYSAVSLDTAGWEKMELPAAWEEAGHPDYDGVVWFRRTVNIPASWAGRDLVLRLSAVDDIETTFVNGTRVGFTVGWDTPRSYVVSKDLIHAGANTLAVRVLDTGGNGGIWKRDLPFDIAPADGSAAPLSLAGAWDAKFAVQFGSSLRAPNVSLNTAGVPTVLYNGMIAPLVPYALRGVAFYQGEANAGRTEQYRKLFPALIADWRRLWKQGDFPFLFVQIAPFKQQPPEIREAQWLSWKTTPNTAMAVTIDCGDAEDIHPANKAPVGRRLALAARALAYGESIPYSGPAYTEAEFKGQEAILHFTYAEGGLVAKGGPLRGFTVAGSDGVFHPAEARIVGDTVVVTAAAVEQPKAVRYGWANVADGNLFNGADLPASPFRTDHP